MRLIECYIENFGKICKQKFEFSKGLNKICQNNSTGKTTLSVFIKVMLYGMSDTKKTSLSENERKHYLPWSGALCSGSITFSVGDKTYRVERSFGQKAGTDTFALYDLNTGKLSSDFSSALGEELFGIDADGFERTVFLSERSLSPKSDNKSVSAKLSDLVGTDGDIGGMDDAIKSLEEERKLLYKKGGAGKISDLRGSITELELELSSLDEIERTSIQNRETAERISAEIAKYNEQLTALATERGAALTLADREKFEENHKLLKSQLAEKIRRQEELIEFFKGTPPSHEEIENAYLDYSRATAITSDSQSSKTDSEEFARLGEYFSKTSDGDISSVSDACDKARGALEKKNLPHIQRARELFSKRIPTRDELDGQINSLTSKTRKKLSPAPFLLMLAAVLAAVGGILLDAPYSYASYAVAAITATSSAILIFSGVRKRRAASNSYKSAEMFINSITDDITQNNPLETLYEMRSMYDIAITDDSEKEYLENIEIIKSFLDKINPCSDTVDPLGEVADVLAKYKRYSELRAKHTYIAESYAAQAQKAEEMLSRANGFLSRYGLYGEAAFAKIREKLLEYKSVTESISEKRREIETFAALHRIGDTKILNARPLSQIDGEREKLEARKNELTRELGALNSSRHTAEMKLFRKDEIIEKKDLLCDELESLESRLQIILMTQKYLEAAKDTLTSKYLGKTKSSFEKYSSVISGMNDEKFEMSTDFGVSRIEGGATRPSDAYSKGTRELYAIAARLALCDSLYGSEKPFIILDDPFASLDDERCRAALKLLRELGKERQIIYFTCSASRI